MVNDEQEISFKEHILQSYPDAIVAEYQLDNHDREKAMDYNFFVRRKLVLVDIIFFIALAATLILLNLFGVLDLSLPLLYGSWGVLILIAIFFITVKMLSGVGGSSTRCIAFTQETIITKVRGEKKKFTLKWSELVHIGKTKNYYFLYPDNTQYLVVPKRCFTPEENERIKSYIL